MDQVPVDMLDKLFLATWAPVRVAMSSTMSHFKSLQHIHQFVDRQNRHMRMGNECNFGSGISGNVYQVAMIMKCTTWQRRRPHLPTPDGLQHPCC